PAEGALAAADPGPGLPLLLMEVGDDPDIALQVGQRAACLRDHRIGVFQTLLVEAQAAVDLRDRPRPRPGHVLMAPQIVSLEHRTFRLTQTGRGDLEPARDRVVPP